MSDSNKPAMEVAKTKPTLCRMVVFRPPTKCVSDGPTGYQQYAAIVTQVNESGSLELATLGPNSLYFQHDVLEFDEKFPADGGWMWPPRS